METEFSEHEPWVQEASCRGLAHEEGSFDTFFADDDDLRSMARAKSMCRGCPVQQACLDYAIRQRIGWGIFGGLTFEERMTVARSRRRRGA